MDSINDEYGNRVNEIKSIFEFMNALQSEGQVELRNKINSAITCDLDSIVYILNSSVLVMLYNLIESTAIGCVEVLYDNLKDKSVSYDNLSNGFKERIFKDFRNGKVKFNDFISDTFGFGVEKSIINSSYSKENYFNGNVDARKIKETFKLFQLDFISSKGHKLIDVKEARNKLAHSESSFERYGRDFTLSDLTNIFEDIKGFFDEFLLAFEVYVNRQGYLSNIPSSSGL